MPVSHSPSPRLAGLAAALLVFLVHLSSLGNGFHYDDGHSLLRNPHIRSLGNLPGFFCDPTHFSENPDYAMYRPVVLLVHALDYAWSGYDPFAYQLTNLLIHCLAVFVVFILFRQLRLSPLPAFIGALAFGLHPVQTEPINYVSSRSESLAGLFFLAAFSAYIAGSGERSTGANRSWILLSLLSFCLALLSKATAATLPLALLLNEYVCRRGSPLLARLKRHIPYWSLTLLYLIIYHTLSTSGVERAVQLRPWPTQWATQLKAIVHYLTLGLIPVEMNVYQQFWEATFHAPAVWLSLGLAGSLLGLALRGRERDPHIAFGLAWFLLTLLPTLLIPLHVLVNDHRLYLPLFGLALILARLSTRVKPVWLLYLLLIGFALVAHRRDGDWEDETTLWRTAVDKAPLMPEAHFNLGHARQQEGDLTGARTAYERAVELSPEYARAQNNLGAVYREMGELDRAAGAFEAALRSDPEMLEALNNLGLVYMNSGRSAEAIRCFEEALQRDPNLAETHFNLGLIYRNMGERDRAFQHLEQALRLKPELRQQYRPNSP